MSTWKDFENAPVGATATNWDESVRVWKKTGSVEYPWWAPFHYEWLSNEGLVARGFTLDPAPAPKTAREALELVWELAHPMKEGHDVPIGTECIAKVRDGEFLTYRSLKPFDGVSRPGWAEARTLDPLPEPDWLDAPAVLAATIFEDRSENRTVFVRENKSGTQWVRDTRFYRWDELIDVVPLYPKGQEA